MSADERLVPHVDRALCSGSGMCVVYAPGTFELDGEARSRVIDPNGDGSEDIAAAVEACPTGALSLGSLSIDPLANTHEETS